MPPKSRVPATEGPAQGLLSPKGGCSPPGAPALPSIENLTDLPRAVVEVPVLWTLGLMNVVGYMGEHLIRVRFTDHTCHHGHTYFSDLKLVLRIPRIIPYSCGRGLPKGPPHVDPQTYEEALVCISAHEGTHVIQSLRPRPVGKEYGYYRKPVSPHKRRTKTGLVDVKPRSQAKVHVELPMFFELEAEWAEHQALTRWRERRK